MAEATQPDQNLQRAKTRSIVLVIIGQGFQSLSIGGISLFLPRIREDMGLSYAQAGLLSSAAVLTYALMQIPAGYLADRLGPRRVFLTGALVSNLMAIAFGLIPWYWLMVANQAVVGVFRALAFIPGMVLMAGWFPPQRRATAIGLYVMGALGGSVAFALAGPPMEAAFNWRFPFVLLGSMGVVVSLLYLRSGREYPGHR